MGVTNQVNVAGFLGKQLSIKGQLGNRAILTGSATLPKVIDRTAIHYEQEEVWNSRPSLIAEAGHLYIYSDHNTSVDEFGNVTNIPAIKIGDGKSYLIDMPFVVESNEEFNEHIKNWAIHVSTQDRDSWESKVTADIDEHDENLILSF